jgi:hypothetical protein
MSPGREKGPHANEGPSTTSSDTLQATDTAKVPPTFDRERVERRARLHGDKERSKASRRLNALLEEPHETTAPSSYGMTPAERRAYGSELIAKGWQPWEVRARLAAPQAANT